MGGARRFRQRTVASTVDYVALDLMLPALRAAGETDTAKEVFAQLKAFFDNANDTFKHHETDYRLQLFSGEVGGALDTLEEMIEDGRGGYVPTWLTNPSELRWWLEFDGVLADPLKSSPRYADILEKRRLHVAEEREAILAIISKENGPAAP